MSKINNAYAGKQITIYSLNGGTTVVQSAMIASSTYSQRHDDAQSFSLDDVRHDAGKGDYFGIDPDPFDPLQR